MRGAALLVGGYVLLGGAGVSAAPADCVPTIIDQQDRPMDEIVIDVPVNADGRSVSYSMLGGTAAAIVSDIALEVPGVAVASITVGGGDASQPREVAPGARVPLVLTVDNVPAGTSEVGFLEATVNDVPTVLATVTVRRGASLSLPDAMSFTSTSQIVTMPLELVNVSDQPIPNASVSFGRLLGPDGEQLTVSGSPAVIAEIAPGDTWDVVATAVAPRLGEYRGTIRLSIGGLVVDTSPVTLIRSNAVLLSESYVFAAPERAVSVPIAITNGSASDVGEVSLDVVGLTAPDGVAVHVDVEPDGTAGFPGDDTRRWVVVAELPIAGSYRGTVVLRSGTAVLDSAPVTFERSTEAIPIVVSPEAGTFRTDFGFGPPFVPVRFRLTDSSGQERKVELTAIVRADDDGDENDDVGSTQLAAACNAGDVLSVDVGGLKPVDVGARVCDLPGPGRYVATVSVADGSRAPITFTSTLLVKRSWPVAGALLAVGVFFAAVYGFLPVFLARRALRQRVRWVRQTLTGLAQAHALADHDVVGALNDRTTELGRPGQDETLQVDALVSQARMVAPYLALQAHLNAVARARGPAMEAIRSFLLHPQPTPEEQKARLDAGFVAAAAEVATTVDIATVLEPLESAITAWERTGAAGPSTLAEVRSALTGARSAYAVNAESGRAATVTTARALSSQLGGLLRAALVNVEPKLPIVRVNSEWAAVAAQTAQIADGLERGDAAIEDSVTNYTVASCELIRVQADAVVTAIDIALGSPPTGMTASELDEWRQQREAVRTQAQAGSTAAQAREQRVAARLLTEAVAEFNALDPNEPEAASVSAELVALPAVVLTSVEAVPIAVAPSPAVRAPWFVAAAETLIASVLAVVVGMQTQYLNDETWGTGGDMVAALVWGIGLSAATVAGFSGVRSALRNQQVTT